MPDTTTVVCLRQEAGNPGGFDDNRYAPCARCGVEVQYRPHAPEPSEKLCVACAAEMMKAEPRDGQRHVELRVTPESVVEIRRWLETRR